MNNAFGTYNNVVTVRKKLDLSRGKSQGMIHIPFLVYGFRITSLAPDQASESRQHTNHGIDIDL